jgi:hypothetical protein
VDQGVFGIDGDGVGLGDGQPGVDGDAGFGAEGVADPAQPHPEQDEDARDVFGTAIAVGVAAVRRPAKDENGPSTGTWIGITVTVVVLAAIAYAVRRRVGTRAQ